MKQQFIQDEIWTLVIGAAFQRSGIYKKDVKAVEKRKFKSELRSHLMTNTEDYGLNNISEKKHLKNIKSLSAYTAKFSSVLIQKKLNFGVSQKLLNLFLKYQWCLGLIPEPPHFPVDRIIQQKLKFRPVLSWTKLDNQKDYLSIITHAKEQICKKHPTLAQLELELFKRTSNG